MHLVAALSAALLTSPSIADTRPSSRFPDTDALARSAEAHFASPPARAFSFDPARARGQSVGRPNGGSLDRGVALPSEGPGFRRISKHRYFGTAETIALITYAGRRLSEAYPGSRPFLVGDISAEDGGRIPPHRSHQSGRDADIAFLEKGNPRRKGFRSRLLPDEIDLEKSWFVIETLLLTKRVRYVFVNEALIKGLEAEARRAGWTAQAVDALFQRQGERRGIIRHARGHTYHFHVRFECPDGDPGCEG